MSINELLKKGIQLLNASNIESPALNAGVILCHVLKCDRVYLYSHGDNTVKEDHETTYIKLIKERMLGKPLQYITGSSEFMSLPFIVSPDVLIPRPETELLVETVLEYLDGIGDNRIDILDMGTGSGCIALSLAWYNKNCFVTAADLSAEALDMAEKNAVRLGLSDRVRFVKSNLFESISADDKFDVIVSNPPYIPSKDIDSLQPEVRDYEPRAALDGGDDGLLFYRQIIAESPKYIKNQGMLALEAGIGQASSIVDLMRKEFINIGIKQDLSGIDRVVTGIIAIV